MARSRGRRPQSPKKGPARLARLPEKYEPSAVRAGRDRKEDEGRREKGWLKLYLGNRDRAEEASAVEKRAEAERWVESVEDIELFGADLPGEKLHGLVVELYRGQCLVEIIPEEDPKAAGKAPGGPGALATAAADASASAVCGASSAVSSAADPSNAAASAASASGSAQPGVAAAGTTDAARAAGKAPSSESSGTGDGNAASPSEGMGGADGESMSWAENLPAAGCGERRLVRCVARGLLKQFDLGYRNLLAVGDRVNLVIPESRGEMRDEVQGFITRILPRRHCVERIAPGWRAVQLLASNVDLLVIVTSAAEPPFRPGFADRALLLAESADIRPLIVLNKADLGIGPEVRRHLEDFAAAGYETLVTSAVTGDGIKELRARLSGRVSILNGQSGVGKSSLLAAMDPTMDVEIGDLSEATGRGRHTTTGSRMYRISGVGWIVDTPGIRELVPVGIRKSNLWQFFPELRRLAGRCAFSDCSHTGEKGCGVEAAAERGEISRRRLEGYRRIRATLPEG